MFAYCLNNPIIFGDFTGEDAVILLDTNNVGHLGIMAQDKNGTWWHFYWGSAPSYMAVCFFNVPANTWCVEYNGAISLTGINSSGQYSGDYEKCLYVNGDFSDCIQTMKKPSQKYNLLFNNCAQLSLRILSSAKTKYNEIFAEASKKVTPNDAYNHLELGLVIEHGNIEKYVGIKLEKIARIVRRIFGGAT